MVKAYYLFLITESIGMALGFGVLVAIFGAVFATVFATVFAAVFAAVSSALVGDQVAGLAPMMGEDSMAMVAPESAYGHCVASAK